MTYRKSGSLPDKASQRLIFRGRWIDLIWGVGESTCGLNGVISVRQDTQDVFVGEPAELFSRVVPAERLHKVNIRVVV